MTLKEKDRLTILEENVSKIVFLLESDEQFHTKGLVEKVDNIGTSLDKLLVREQIYKTKATTWGIVGGAIGTVFLWIGKVIFAKFI